MALEQRRSTRGETAEMRMQKEEKKHLTFKNLYTQHIFTRIHSTNNEIVIIIMEIDYGK
jgi:hypothetical protein